MILEIWHSLLSSIYGILKTLIREHLLGLATLENEFFIPLVIGDRKFIRPTADLAVFDIFLNMALGGIDKCVIDFSAVSAAVISSPGFSWILHQV
jgi:hypothetical protein